MTQKNISANGLHFKERTSSAITFIVNPDEDLLKHAPKENAWFIAYLFHRVVIGQIKDGKFKYYQDDKNDVVLANIQKLRVFNKDAELFVWRTALGGFKARLREDEKSTGHDSVQGMVDANQVLFGTKIERIDDTYVKLKEDRGTEIIMPLAESGIKDSEINERTGRLCIHTRSYIGFIEDTGQATYEDVRFVEFVKYEGGQI